jgi:hypothetical protein
LEAENLNLSNADLIVFQAIDYGYQVPTVHWVQPLEKKKRQKAKPHSSPSPD